MNRIKRKAACAGIVICSSVLIASCVTETVESDPSIKFTDTAVISVQDPATSIAAGSSIAWLPAAVHFYNDKRFAGAPLKDLIEAEIVDNVKAKSMHFVESSNGSTYSIAYTAALESSLDDSTIIRRFGLLPGNSQVPTGDTNIEKGSLIIYVFNNADDTIVWRSAAQVGVHFDLPMDERKQNIKRVIAEMFQTFPVSTPPEK